jgi:GNAT superfamily N-acetyltransferase
MQKHLATETDKLGNIIEVMQCDSITEVRELYSFFLRRNAELIDLQMAYPLITWEDTDGAVYITYDDKIIGHIVYSIGGPAKREGMIWITLSAVDPDYRGRGLYTIMHKYFEQIGRDNGCTNMASLIHKRNSTRLKSAEKVGMIAVFNYMMKDIT